ncbi:hypothetical protein PS6_011037, partial [Mucor atramentarius]
YLARVYDQGVKLSIDGNYISASCSFQDAGVNFTIYCSHSHLLKYLTTRAKPNSYHHVWGAIIVTAYQSTRTGRPAYSMKMNCTKIGVAKISGTGTINLDAVNYDINIADSLAESEKYKFMLGLFLLQNWGQQVLDEVEIDYNKGSRADLARLLLQQQERLMQKSFIPMGSEPVVQVQEELLEPRARLRPGVIANEVVNMNARLVAINLSMLNEDNLFDGVSALPALVPIAE